MKNWQTSCTSFDGYVVPRRSRVMYLSRRNLSAAEDKMRLDMIHIEWSLVSVNRNKTAIKM